MIVGIENLGNTFSIKGIETAPVPDEYLFKAKLFRHHTCAKEFYD